jgi:hypothetical protein
MAVLLRLRNGRLLQARLALPALTSPHRILSSNPPRSGRRRMSRLLSYALALGSSKVCLSARCTHTFIDSQLCQLQKQPVSAPQHPLPLRLPLKLASMACTRSSRTSVRPRTRVSTTQHFPLTRIQILSTPHSTPDITLPCLRTVCHQARIAWLSIRLRHVCFCNLLSIEQAASVHL